MRATATNAASGRACTLAAGVITLALSVSACVLRPPETADERAKLAAASQPFETPLTTRQSPDLPPQASWRDVLSRAFLANGELESAYFEWQAALARIDQAAVWPNSDVAVTFSYLFSSENVKAWDRATLGVGFDPSMNLSLPVKARAAGKAALAAAREAGERFRAVKFDLQRKVLSAYLDLALTEELIRIQQDNRRLLKLVADSAADRAEAGGPMQDLFRAMIELQTADGDLASLEAQARSKRNMLNGMLARDPDAPLTLPASLPAPRAIGVDDSRLIAAGVAHNPELAALARQVAGRTDAIEVARLAYLPDFSSSASITGSVSQAVGTMVMLPTRAPAIRAAIEEAQAMEHSSEAMLRQARHERAASFVATLYAIRNAERQAQLYQRSIVPAAEQLVVGSRSAYAAGTLGFADLIDSERMLLTMRRMVAEARIGREQRLAELEALMGADIEPLAAAPAGASVDCASPREEP